MPEPRSYSIYRLGTSNVSKPAIGKAAQRLWHTATVVLCLTHSLSAQDTRPSKIPEGQAKFTREQLAQYYLVYRNADVKYLRTLFDAYLDDSGGSDEERQLLQKWDKAYFRSKFIVMSRENNTFGGTLIQILFQDRPDKVFIAWVYPEGADKRLALQSVSTG